MRSRFSIFKDLFFAILAFLSAGIILVVVMTAASTYFFPTTVQIVESRYSGTGIPAEGTESNPSETEPLTTGPSSIEGEAEPESISEKEPASAEAIAEGSSSESGEESETSSPAPAGEEILSLNDELTAEAQPDLSGVTSEELENIMDRGESLPLGDGRIAYRVQSGDTFSQISKKVTGTGKPEIWRQAAREMNIDYRRIQPGSVLIFSPEIIEAAKPYVEAAERGE